MQRERLVRLAMAARLYRPARLAYERVCRPELGREHRLLIDRLRPWIGRGDLAFDVGAHLGRFTAALRALGARVVAVEPNPNTATELRAMHGRDRDAFRLVPAAIGEAPGTARLRVNAHRHSMCTLSDAFVESTRRHAAWAADDRWDAGVDVPVATLDALIAEHGVPRLIKLDVEGFEREALAGLSTPPQTVCFEYRARMSDAGMACVRRLADLGDYALNFVGRDDRLALSDWCDTPTILSALANDPRATEPSHVDVIARRREASEPAIRLAA